MLSYTINTFPLPVANSGPNIIEAGPDGNVWFLETGRNTLGRITPTGQITEVPLPVPAFNEPVVFGPDGNIWLALQTGIAEITPQGDLLHDYAIPSSSPPGIPGTGIAITMGSDGNIWYIEPYTNDLIGRLTPDGQITEFAVPGNVLGNDGAANIISGPDGKLWFTATDANFIGSITTAGVIQTFSVPGGRGLTNGPDGNLWETAGDYILRVNTQGQLTGQFQIPTANSGAYGMTVGSDGALWFAEGNVNQIGRITTDGNITEIPVTTGNINNSPEITTGPDGNIWFSESYSNSIGELVSQTATTTTVAASANPSVLNQPVTFTATVTPAAGTDTPTGSVDFFDTTTNTDLGSVSLSNGTAMLSTSTLAVGSHTVTATYSGDGSFQTSQGSTSLTVLAPASLSGIVFEDFNDNGQVDFGEQGIAGVTITLTGTDDVGQAVNQTQVTDGDGAYVFLNLRPGNYYLTETQPAGYQQGIDTVGTAGGSLAATDQFFVALGQGVNGFNYNYGEQPPSGGAPQSGQTATIGFWNNKNGQALIQSFNGGSTSTQLGNWLAATLPNMFGANAGSNDLAGKSNAEIAALFQSDFLLKGVKLDAQVLATALSVYATNATLDNTDVAANYGFIVSGNGLGTATVNVGSNGAAFGVADNSVLTVLDLLKATDAQAVGGLLYNGDATLRKEANNIYSAINEEGDIG